MVYVGNTQYQNWDVGSNPTISFFRKVFKLFNGRYYTYNKRRQKMLARRREIRTHEQIKDQRQEENGYLNIKRRSGSTMDVNQARDFWKLMFEATKSK